MYSDEICEMEMAEHSHRQSITEFVSANRTRYVRYTNSNASRQPTLTREHQEALRALLNMELYAMGLEVRRRPGWNGGHA